MRYRSVISMLSVVLVALLAVTVWAGPRWADSQRGRGMQQFEQQLEQGRHLPGSR